MGPSHYEKGLAEQDQWLADKLEELRLTVDALQHESDDHRERLEALESLPGVQLALKVAREEK